MNRTFSREKAKKISDLIQKYPNTVKKLATRSAWKIPN